MVVLWDLEWWKSLVIGASLANLFPWLRRNIVACLAEKRTEGHNWGGLVDFESLGLKIGNTMQLERVGNPARYPVRLIGLEPTKGLIITPPKGSDGKYLFMKEGQGVIIRLALLNSVMAFATQVLEDRAKPYPHVHLALPREIESIEVRRAVRVATDLMATVINESQESHSMAVTMVDLSPMGARLESAMALAEKGDRVSVTVKLPMASYDYTVTLTGTVVAAGLVHKNGEEAITENAFYFGLQFEGLDAEDAAPLHAFVYQELLKQLNVL
jgi:c-di-GMP-binding flagellar brake protein YcgR